MTTRLMSSNPDVHRAFDALEPAEKKRVATRIVLWAVEQVGGDSDEVASLLSSGSQALLEAICAEMEEQYFHLLERYDEGCDGWFSKARTYSGSGFLARDEFDDAIYESIFATEKSLQISDFL